MRYELCSLNKAKALPYDLANCATTQDGSHWPASVGASRLRILSVLSYPARCKTLAQDLGSTVLESHRWTNREGSLRPTPTVRPRPDCLSWRENDASAWRQLLQVYGPVVRYWIQRAGVTSADVSDVFHNVFSAVSTNLHRFQRQDGRGSFRIWLKAITNSKVTYHHRKIGRQPNAIGGSTAHAKIAARPDEVIAASAIEQISEETV